jgi:hypothetical protein
VEVVRGWERREEGIVVTVVDGVVSWPRNGEPIKIYEYLCPSHIEAQDQDPKELK